MTSTISHLSLLEAVSCKVKVYDKSRCQRHGVQISAMMTSDENIMF